MNKEFGERNEYYENLKLNLRKFIPESVVPDFELQYKAEIVAQINELKKQKNAVILGHNYMEPVLYYTVPDFRGDSLELSKRAAETTADTIVFCGVHFMAETAKILNPSKKVLIPAEHAGCSLAEGITARDIIDLKESYPDIPVITYINSTAEVKAVSDVCATSGNVTKVVQWARDYFHSDTVMFLPDKYMAGNVAKELGMDLYIPKKGEYKKSEFEVTKRPTIIGWDARCYVHEQYTPEHIKQIRDEYPGAAVLAHPECPPSVIEKADFSGSTSAMVKYVAEHKDKKIALLTECSMADNIVATNPEANDNLIRMCNIRCKFMHMITLEQTLDALKYDQYEVTIPEEIRRPAEVAVRRMIAIG